MIARGVIEGFEVAGTPLPLPSAFDRETGCTTRRRMRPESAFLLARPSPAVLSSTSRACTRRGRALPVLPDWFVAESRALRPLRHGRDPHRLARRHHREAPVTALHIWRNAAPSPADLGCARGRELETILAIGASLRRQRAVAAVRASTQWWIMRRNELDAPSPRRVRL